MKKTKKPKRKPKRMSATETDLLLALMSNNLSSIERENDRLREKQRDGR